MMRKFAAALLATALIAGPAFAASATGNTDNTAAAQTVKPAKSAKAHHVRNHRHNVVRHRNGGKLAAAHHIKRHKKHGHYVARVAKPVKTDKAGKSDKS
jgi:hypothetical protein